MTKTRLFLKPRSFTTKLFSRGGLGLTALLCLTNACMYGTPTDGFNGGASTTPGAAGPGNTVGQTGPSGSNVTGNTTNNTTGTSTTGANGVTGVTGSSVTTGQPLVDGVAAGAIRRLSSAEIGNTFESLFAVRPVALAQIPADKKDYAYDRVVQSQTVTGAHLDAFAAIADELSTTLTPDKLAPLVPACAGTLGTDGQALATQRRSCIDGFITTIGRRAFRRPVDATKKASLLALYDSAGTYADGLRLVLNAIFAGPDFLYVIETGTAVSGKPGIFALNDYELATRLSLLVCETIPDATLAAAADAGQLKTPAQLTAQAERLFGLPCARRSVTRFFRQWLDLEKVADLDRDPTLFPTWTDTLRQAMMREQESFFPYVTFDSQGSLKDLFTANYSFVDKDLAPLYGMSMTATTMQKVVLPTTRRGLLTQPSVLAVTAHAKETSPVRRGVYVLERLLCRALPPPPKNLNLSTPAPDATTTTQSRWEKHSANAACSGCHSIIDPIGFAMEDFDAIGRYRSSENGQTIKTNGAIPALGTTAGQVTGGASLSDVIANNDELAGCFSRQWFRFALGRLDGDADAKALADMTTATKNNNPMRATMTSVVTSFAFRNRAVAAN